MYSALSAWVPFMKCFTHSFGNIKSNKKQDLTNTVSDPLLWFAFGSKTVSLILANDKVHCHDKEPTYKAKAHLQHTLFLLNASEYLCGITGWPFALLEDAWCTIPLMSEQTTK